MTYVDTYLFPNEKAQPRIACTSAGVEEPRETHVQKATQPPA